MVAGLILGGDDGEVSVSEGLSGAEVGTVQLIQATDNVMENRRLVPATYRAMSIDGYFPEGAPGLTDARLVPLAPPILPASGRGQVAAAGELTDESTSGQAVDERGGEQFADGRALPSVEPPESTSIETVICSFDWPQGCEYWVAVAFCESGLRPYAIGYGGNYVGLFQVWGGHGYGYDWLLVPHNNTLAAWELSKEGTVTSPWPVCQYP